MRNISPSSGLTVSLANGDTISSLASGVLDIGDAKLAPIPAHIFDSMHLTRSLYSLSDFCNRGCKVVLTGTDISVCHDDEVIMRATKHPLAKLWPAPQPVSSPSIALKETLSSAAPHVVVRNKLNGEFVAFSHASLGEPCKAATWPTSRISQPPW